MGGPGQMDFRRKAKEGKASGGAIILPYFRINFFQFLEEMERRGFTTY